MELGADSTRKSTIKSQWCASHEGELNGRVCRDLYQSFGRFRGAFHTSVVVRSDENSVSPIMQAVTLQELEASLLEAFELLRKKTTPTGESIEKQIEAASDLLKRKS